MKKTVFTLCGAWALLLSPTLSHAVSDRPVFSVPRLSRAPKLEDAVGPTRDTGMLSQMTKIDSFIQREPRDGEPSTQQTEVFLGHDGDNLYVIFVASDSEPDKVRAHLAPRESVYRDDIVEIMLDTFADRRRAVAFICNPLGVQWDALWTEGSEFDQSFDTVWHSKGQVTDSGFVVWMSIPFKSLRFPATDVQNWGVIFARDIRRDSEETFWPHVSSRDEGRLNQAATLQINETISGGRNVQIIPYGTYRTFRLLDEEHPEGPRFTTEPAEADIGFDAKYVIKDKLVLDATVNPDFSQVESDEPQITVNQRFEVFFPEKRAFFLENANFFQTPFNLMFTRRIGDPFAGGRLTGKLGPYAIGALVVDDRAPGKIVPPDDPNHDKRAYYGVFRISRDLFEQSSLGLVYTDREFGDGYNRVAGIDGRFKLSPNWTTTFQGLMSATKDRKGDDTGELTSRRDPAFSFQLDHGGRQFEAHYRYVDIGRDFQTEAGFVPRTDIRDLRLSNDYRFRPEGDLLIAWGPDLDVQRIWDQSGTRLDDGLAASVELELVGETTFEVGFAKLRELLRPGDFEGLTQNMDFSMYDWMVEFETELSDLWQAQLELNVGTEINLDPPEDELPDTEDRVEGEIEFSLKPNTKFRVDTNYILFQLNDDATGGRILRNQIVRSRWSWQFSRELSLRTILEYDITTVNAARTSLERETNFNVDLLITYLVNPWTALYVGVNSNYQNLDFMTGEDGTELVRTRDRMLNDGRQFFVKYSHLIRF